MTPKSFEINYFILMSDLEKMVLEDVASYQTKQGRTLLFNTKSDLECSIYTPLRNTVHYSKAVTDYWSNYFDERP